MWLGAQLKTFAANGVMKLVDRSSKGVEKLGDYVENGSLIVLV
jgi:hypothetical protein